MRLNDVFFAAHASCITLLTLAQCALYDRGSQRVHARTRTAFAVMAPVTVVYAAAVWLAPEVFPMLWCAPHVSVGLFVKALSLPAKCAPGVKLTQVQQESLMQGFKGFLSHAMHHARLSS